MSALTIAAALSMFSAACSSDENITGEQQQPDAVKTYQVSIPASFAEGTRAVTFDGTTSTSTFASTEKVYVYNATTDEVMGGYLTPTEISDDGKDCNLTGTLTGGTISSGDNLKLFYNLSNVSTNKEGDIYKWYTCFEYVYQGGTQSGVLDGAEAAVTVSSYTGGVLTTTATAEFQNLQSMFRFQFKDENGTAINVKSLKIQSYNSALITYYYPLQASDLQNSGADYVVTLATATTGYIYVAIRIDESSSSGDELTFIATDNDGNEYKGTKSAPSGGFKNGKYYYNSSAITLTKQAARIKPTITWTSVYDGVPVSPNEFNCYNVYGPWNDGTSNYDPSEITISVTSSGYYFWMNMGATIHLNGLTATYDDNYSFIGSPDNLNLVISNTNSITCKNWSQAIYVDGALKLSGSGTLTVTVNDASRYGIFATSNYDDDNNSDASVLAATGYTVTRSARTDNADGTYTWTYTVAPQ